MVYKRSELSKQRSQRHPAPKASPLLLAGLWCSILGISLPMNLVASAIAEEIALPETAPAPEAAPVFETAPVFEAAPEPDLSIQSAEPAPDFYSETAPNSPQAQTDPAQSERASDPYIDTQDYSIGATEPYSPPERVVVNERSSGCQSAYGTGQAIASSLCGTPPAQQLYTMPSRSETQPAWANVPTNWDSPSPQGTSAQTVQNTLQYTVAPPSNLALKPVTGANPLKWIFPNGERMIFPLPIPVDITSVFGWRIHPISGEWRFHSGTDLGAPMGTPVLAAYSGRVSLAEFLGGYGLSILLDHNQGSAETRYAHLSEVFVKPGQWVQQGTVIGLVGSTGNSTGPHLHFETLQANQGELVAVDPTPELQSTLTQLATALQTARLTAQATPNRTAAATQAVVPSNNQASN